MTKATGSNIGKQLCDALGLDSSRVHSLHIDVEPDNIVIVNAVLNPDIGDMETFGKVMREYKLVPKEEVSDVTPLGAKVKEFRKNGG